MKIVICDYKTDLSRDLKYEIDCLKKGLGNSEIVVYEYKDNKQELINILKDADAVINTYVTLDREVLSQVQTLKCIALNAVGFNMVDLTAATENGIMVCPAAEYCTNEVAEHTMALIFALSRGLRKYIMDVENYIWDYMGAGAIERISGKTIAVFGFGKIGKAVTKRAQAMGLKVLVVTDPIVEGEEEAYGVKMVDWKYAFAQADIISNHMALTAENTGFFNVEKFSKCRKRPMFINTGRGGSVVEEDLVTALEEGYLSACGLDVLESENPDLQKLALLGRDNVIITPHTAFFSAQAAKDLQDISCNSVIAALTGRYDDIDLIINRSGLQI